MRKVNFFIRKGSMISISAPYRFSADWNLRYDSTEKVIKNNNGVSNKMY